MNTRSTERSTRAFTLIELLVVIAIIALLAALIFPVTATVNRQKIRSKARTELTAVESAIESYKAKLGFYPPGNPNNYALTPLFYELAGATLQNNTYETLDKSASIRVADLNSTLGVSSLANSVVGAGSDEGRQAQRFLVGTRPYPTTTVQEGADPTTSPRLLATSVGWKKESTPILPNNTKASPVFYNPINPTNNPSSYDLWIDVIVGDKTNRISNWSKEPLTP
jgi:prepilin-type N-terminal cleavage/methylation domain-containing protein